MASASELAEELDPEAVRIGTVIRTFRKDRDRTLASLGDAVGHTHSYLSKIERGLLRAPDALCNLIADELGVPRAAITTPTPSRQGGR